MGGQSRPIEANGGQSTPTEANRGQQKSDLFFREFAFKIVANRGQSRPSNWPPLASLGLDWPPFNRNFEGKTRVQTMHLVSTPNKKTYLASIKKFQSKKLTWPPTFVGPPSGGARRMNIAQEHRARARAELSRGQTFVGPS